MKTTLSLIIILMTTIVATANTVYDKHRVPDPKIVKALKTKYPDAKRVEWETKHNYYVAEFYIGNTETEAWFNQEGAWQMTQSELSYNLLPEIIKNNFITSEYATWKTEDVKKIERMGMETIYILEIEKGETEIDLYYTENGILLKRMSHSMKQHLPETLPQAVFTFIQQKYPQATIIEIDREKGMLEVEIFDNNLKKEVVFNTQDQWQTTTWEVRKNSVPASILNALQRAGYKDYRIDDIHFQQRNNGSEVYIFDLEKGNNEINLTLNAANGEVISNMPKR
ncbi:PepSY-like domain-containing protein [uncultured Sanguibacteroides sp.]|uniref:PepSY-like domain-containing protein n=1 Tax=uncultured Sanguibacteroides sp. TaxID=1635151 RepID=UPI0025F778CF|nr:PepSY-like domain-containing protein [uncultured Sanguibacteroides sp.]